MTETCLQTGRRARLEAERRRLAPVVSHTSILVVDAGGLWLLTDCIHHDLAAIRRQQEGA